jgi:anti-sigma regulatory factor (Ser/Thr protein kinase)
MVAAVDGLLSAVDHEKKASIDLEARPESLSTARDFVRRMLAVWDCDDPDQVVALMTNELVSNAVRHAGGAIRLEMSMVDGEDIRVQASDQSPDAPVAQKDVPSGEGGLGLRIVESLARCWGVERHDSFKTVWFETPAVHRPAARH